MKATVKRAWLKALRSGKYKQTKGILRSKTGGFCCLGVLCDIRDKQLKRTQWTASYSCFSYGKRYNDGTLPVSVQKWAGLKSADPIVTKDEKSLADLNDSGRSFKHIANVIARQL